MATKAPSTATRLKNANAELKELRLKVEALERDHKYEKGYRERAEKEREDLRSELEQLHGLLDAMEGAAPRKTVGKDQWGSDTEINNKAMTRLASWLAKGKA